MDKGTQPYALPREEGQAVWFLGTLVIMNIKSLRHCRRL